MFPEYYVEAISMRYETTWSKARGRSQSLTF